VVRLIKFVFLAGLAAFLFGLYKGDALPPPGNLLPVLENEPDQRPAQKPPFDTTVNEVTYHIRPLYRYELWGLIVSRHHAGSFIDYAHKEWGDHLNTVDLCVVWGRNAFSGVYQRMSFSSDQWTCFARSSAETWQQFSMSGLANNHILADRSAIRRQLKQARPGDQVHFRGYLAEYSHDGGFSRGTSTVRTDTGNGACETVFIEEFDILRSGPGHWRMLRWLAGFAMLAALAAWLMLPDRFYVGN
jgi:hypothetical protein